MSKELTKELARIQKELKAPKGQLNKFGNYNYRSCEDILEAVKPLLNGLVVFINDHITQVGDRYYVEATAVLSNGEESIHATAYAREADNKKGMDEAQITGATSSYARKYALNGLFAIDDTKDADTQDNRKSGDIQSLPITKKQAVFINKLLIQKGQSKENLYKKYQVKSTTELSSPVASTIIDNLMKLPDAEIIEDFGKDVEVVDVDEVAKEIK